jgi:hypothetical protein
MIDLIKQYINSLYNRYNRIIIDAPIGFGSYTHFSKSIINDLYKNRKSCLVVSYLQLFSKQYYQDMIKGIDNSMVYRTNESKYIEFNNGSLIEFITFQDLVKNNFTKLSQDIIYIDGYRTDIGHRFTDELIHLIHYYKKIILVSSYIKYDLRLINKIKSIKKPIIDK